MNETFIDFLNGMRAEPDMIQQALRMYLSERTNDLTRKEMLTELHAAVTSAEELDRLLNQLERKPDALEQAALVYFEHAWEEDAQRPSIRTVFEHAKGKLPVVETAILAVTAMYCMYLIATGGVTKITRTIKKNPAGSYEATEVEEREPFSPVVSAIAGLFGKKG
jgi:hypothetical protein